MKKTQIMTKMSSTFNQVGFQLKKHSPEILVVAGVVGVVTSAVMACRATTKVGTIIEEAKESVDKIHDNLDCGCTEDGEEYTPDDSKKELTVVYLQTGVKVAKLYGPSVILGGLSIAGILASNNILRKRNIALAAAYATVDKSFKEYRSRVIERFGEEVDRQLKFDIKTKEVEEKVIDENGNEKTVKKTVEVINPSRKYSEYAKIFDQLNDNWQDNPDYNKMFLRQVENYMNDKLRVNKRVFLNEVYKELGFEPTKAGQVVGWKLDPNDPKSDNYIDFGIYDVTKESSSRFLNECESAVILDFNVDGNVWEDML